MKLSAASCVAALTLGFATPGAAAALVDSFQSACVKTAGAPADVEAYARQANWMVMPDSMLSPLAKQLNDSSFKARDIRGWIRSDQSSLALMIVARADFPVKIGASGVFCAVAALPKDPEAGSALARWIGVPAMAGATLGPVGEVYAFTVGGDGAHKEIPASVLAKDTAALTALSDPGARIMFTQTDAQMTMLAQFTLEREL